MYEMNEVKNPQKLQALQSIQAAYPDLDEKLVPIVVIVGKGTDKKKFRGAYESAYIPQKGKVFFYPDSMPFASDVAKDCKEDVNLLEFNKNRKNMFYWRGYAKYHKHPTDSSLDVLEMAQIKFPLDNFDRKAAILTKKKWEKSGCGSIYLFRDDQFPYIFSQGQWIKANVYEEGKYYNKALTRWIEGVFGRTGCNEITMKEVNKFFYGTRDMNAFKGVRIYNGYYSVSTKYEQLSRTLKKKEELKTVLGYPLKPISEIEQETCVYTRKSYVSNSTDGIVITDLTYYEKLPNNEGYVLRSFEYDFEDLKTKVDDYNANHHLKGIGNRLTVHNYWGTSFYEDGNDPQDSFANTFTKINEIKPKIWKETGRLYVLKKDKNFQCEHLLSTMTGEEIDEFVPIKAGEFSPFNAFNTEKMNIDGYTQQKRYKTK